MLSIVGLAIVWLCTLQLPFAAEIHDVPGVILRTVLNGGALDANGEGNSYSERGTRFDAKWKWLTPNNATPPFRWLKWQFDSSLIKSGAPPDLDTGATGQVCLECNGSTIDCNIIVAACHGNTSQQWSLYATSMDIGYTRAFSIKSVLHPDRCVTFAGSLNTTEWYWGYEVSNHGVTQKVKKYLHISGLGYKLAECRGITYPQLFYVNKQNSQLVANL